MKTLLFSISRLSELTREYGLREALGRAWKRATADITLVARETWWTLAGRRLPSESEVLSRMDRRWPSLESLVDHLCCKDSPVFLFAPADKARRVAQWRKSYPKSVQRTLQRAEEICHYRLEFLGAQYDFGGNGYESGEVDWHLDVASGRRWPRDYIERINRWMWSGSRLGDYKPIWELNRHQYFSALGKAYWLTGEEKYAQTCAGHVLSWIRHNPYPFGINWYSALEIGVRLVAWGLAFHFFRSSRHFASIAGEAFVRSLYQQASFLRKHLTLEWRGRNNHTIGEAAALVYIGALFDEFAEAGEWCEKGLRIVEREVARQTHPDGVNREQAMAYHGFVLDFVLLLIALARRGAIRPAPSLETLAEKMLEYVMFAMTPAGDLPALGDADDGRGFLLGVGGIRESFRETLAIGAVLFQRPDFKFVARDFGEGAFWLLGEQGLTTFEDMEPELPECTSVAFPQGGQYVIRGDWTEVSDYGLLRCGEFGLAGEGFCAHAHCDLLSPVLWIKGRPLLIDSGTCTYHGPWRDLFRSTGAHNTVVVDGQEQATPTGPFSWRQVPAARCEVWERQRIVSSLKMPNGVTFRRELAHPRPGTWRLTDSFEGVGQHRIDWAFHLAPGLVPIPLPQDNRMRIASDAEPGWSVMFRAPDVTFVTKDGWVSFHYGERTRNKVIRACWRGNLKTAATSFTWEFSLAASELC